MAAGGAPRLREVSGVASLLAEDRVLSPSEPRLRPWPRCPARRGPCARGLAQRSLWGPPGPARSPLLEPRVAGTAVTELPDGWEAGAPAARAPRAGCLKHVPNPDLPGLGSPGACGKEGFLGRPS